MQRVYCLTYFLIIGVALRVEAIGNRTDLQRSQMILNEIEQYYQDPEPTELTASAWFIGDTMLQPGDACPSPGTPDTRLEGERVLSDLCMQHTVAVSWVKVDPTKPPSATPSHDDYTWLVISDLTNALKCGDSGKCECLEPGAAATSSKDGRVICRKSDVKNNEECIHHEECLSGMCLFGASNGKNGDSGNMGDFRRYCVGKSTNNLPSLVGLILTVLLTILFR